MANKQAYGGVMGHVKGRRGMWLDKHVMSMQGASKGILHGDMRQADKQKQNEKREKPRCDKGHW